MLRRAEETFERMIRDDLHVVEYRETLAMALVSLGKRERQAGRAAEAIREYQRACDLLEESPYGSADGLYHLAGVQAQCTALADAGSARPGGIEPADRQAYLNRAMVTLHRSVAAGFDDGDRPRRDTNLDPLRSLAVFRVLEMGLMDAAFPSDSFSP